MKNLQSSLKIFGVTLALGLVLLAACKDDDDGTVKLSRQFSPAEFTLTNGETSATVEWAPSLFTLPGEAQYAVEVSADPADFSNPVFTGTTSEPSVTITDETLEIKKDYYARVKAVGTNGTNDSNWAVSDKFRILGEQFLLPVADGDIIDNKAILRWKENPALTRIKITPAGGTSFEVTLTANDHTALQKLISGLTPQTTYEAEIFQDTKSKGTVTFTTKAAITGVSVIDLRGKTGRPSILLDTLPSIPSGSIVVLDRNQAYNVSSSFQISKTVTILSGLDFGSSKATLRMTAAFNLAAGSNIDSIVFQDVQIKGSRASFGSYNNDYLMNANTAANVGKVRLENCIIKILRGVVRGQAGGAGTKYANYVVNNCVLDSIRDFGIAAASSASAMANIQITNTTVYRARKFIIHAVAGNSSVTIRNCTFNELVAGANPAANYFIDFSSSATGGITIQNTIFGKVWDETGAGNAVFGIRAPNGTAINVTNSYNTSDFVNSTNPIPGLSAYSGTAAALFTDPDNGNFKISDAAFIGKSSAGDPRWRL